MDNGIRHDGPTNYRIKILESLGTDWKEWFGGFMLSRDTDNGSLLTGMLADQAALHGLLRKVRDLGLTLVSIKRMETQAVEKENDMIDAKANARITGFLFILGSLPPIVAAMLWGPIVSSPDYLSAMAAHSSQILLLALSVMFMGFACAGIGISMYPVLKPRGEAMALGAMGFRIMEGTLQVASAAILVALLALSQEFVKAGSPADSWFQPAAAAIKGVREWMANGVYLFPWCIGSFIYYAVFYRTRLLPRWLSAWGLLGLALMLAGAFAGMFGLLRSFSPVQLLLMLPIMAQEMVLAAWLIIKGYKGV